MGYNGRVVKVSKHNYNQFYGIEGEVVLPNDPALERLISLQCSATRAIYSYLKKDGTKEKLYQTVKPQYPDLPSRYFNACVAIAEALPTNEKVIFGGKKNFERYIHGEISKKRFIERRDNTLYSQAFKGKGNELLIITKNHKGTCLLIRKPNLVKGYKASFWECPMKLPRYSELHHLAYSVRLTRIKGRKFEVNITWSIPKEKPVLNAGCLSVDVNYSRLAWSNLDKNGNLINYGEIVLPRITVARADKRLNDIILAGKEIALLAKQFGKSIIVEKLNFGKSKSRKKRHVNRMAHNFCYRKLLEQIERQATKLGIPVRSVFAGYTSILGLAKYAEMYKLNRHTAAAVVIGRRGMGFVKERMNFEVTIKLPKAKKGSNAQQGNPDSGVSKSANGNMDCSIRKKARFRPVLSELSLTRLSNQWVRQSDRNRSLSRDHIPSNAEVSNRKMNLPRQHDNKIGKKHAVRIGRSKANRPACLTSRGKNLARANRAILGNSTCRNYQLLTIVNH